MIVPRHIIMNDRITFENVNLNHTYYFFNDIKNIDLNLLNIRKTYAKILMLLKHHAVRAMQKTLD